jgi:hypothetical protein
LAGQPGEFGQPLNLFGQGDELNGTGLPFGSPARIGQQASGEAVDEGDAGQVNEQERPVAPQQVQQVLLKPRRRIDVDVPMDLDQSVAVTPPHQH